MLVITVPTRDDRVTVAVASQISAQSLDRSRWCGWRTCCLRRVDDRVAVPWPLQSSQAVNNPPRNLNIGVRTKGKGTLTRVDLAILNRRGQNSAAREETQADKNTGDHFKAKNHCCESLGQFEL